MGVLKECQATGLATVGKHAQVGYGRAIVINVNYGWSPGGSILRSMTSLKFFS